MHRPITDSPAKRARVHWQSCRATRFIWVPNQRQWDILVATRNKALAKKNALRGGFLLANLGEAMVCISLDTLTGETLVCTHSPVNNQVAMSRPCFIGSPRDGLNKSLYFRLTSVPADFEGANRSKKTRSPANFCISSRRKHLAAAIAHIAGASLLHSSVNADAPSTDSIAQTTSPVVRCSSPSRGSAPWYSQAAA